MKLAIFVNFNVNLIKEGIHRKIQGRPIINRQEMILCDLRVFVG